ncbi:hypothetical protein GH733_017704, partial [Mirounga leonina]
MDPKGILQQPEAGGIFKITGLGNDDISSPSAQQTCKQCELCEIQHRFISSTDLAWMVQDNHLSRESSCFHWWVIFAVTSHIALMNIFDRNILDIEAHIVPRMSLTQSFLVHFNRLYFSCNIDWRAKDIIVTRLEQGDTFYLESQTGTRVRYGDMQDGPFQQEDSDPPKEYDPGQFAGLLHGSSPACESPENPFHLYGKRDECEEGKDEIDKIMNSIDVGINSELKEMNGEITKSLSQSAYDGSQAPEDHVFRGGSKVIFISDFLEFKQAEDITLGLGYTPITIPAKDYRYYPVDGYSLLKRFPLHPLTGPRCPVQTVGQWLESIGLPQYENHLMANGFDNVQFM